MSVERCWPESSLLSLNLCFVCVHKSPVKLPPNFRKISLRKIKTIHRRASSGAQGEQSPIFIHATCIKAEITLSGFWSKRSLEYRGGIFWNDAKTKFFNTPSLPCRFRSFLLRGSCGCAGTEKKWLPLHTLRSACCTCMIAG